MHARVVLGVGKGVLLKEGFLSIVTSMVNPWL